MTQRLMERRKEGIFSITGQGYIAPPKPSLKDDAIVKTPNFTKHYLPSNVDTEIPQLTRAWVSRPALLVTTPDPSLVASCLPGSHRNSHSHIQTLKANTS